MNFENICSNIYNTFNESTSNYKFKIIKPANENGVFTDLSEAKNAIFLAGPCPRKNYDKEDWRNEAYKILNNLAFDGVVLNPTNKYYTVTKSLKMQSDWETEAFHRASAIVFNLDKSDDHPGFTTNVEFGRYFNWPNIYVYKPKDNDSRANAYIYEMCIRYNIPIFETLEDTLAAVVKNLSAPGKTWYTSDTHFGQERTLNFSMRPFKNTDEMDLALISNWNKNIHKNDIVYFLGDFGESAKYLDGLNYKEMHFIKGNYEREKTKDVLKDIKKNYKNITIYDNDECIVESNGFKYILRHEPITGQKIEKDYICLFGHIHAGLNGVKENGINVAVDVRNYSPMSQERVDFIANAITQGYYDEQVYSAKCK